MPRPRTRLRSEISRLFEAGEFYRGRWMNVRTGPSHLNRALISVRRAFGGAVLRNRARRRLKSVLRDVVPRGHPGKLVFITVADRARSANYAQLRDELICALRTLRLLEP